MLYAEDEVTQAPVVREDVLRSILQREYGIVGGRVHTLTGYEDCNFKLTEVEWEAGSEEGPSEVIVKITNPIEARDTSIIDTQYEVFAHLRAAGVPTPEGIRTRTGEWWRAQLLPEEPPVSLPVRVFRLLPGTNLENFDFTPALVTKIGRMLATVHAALDSLPAAGTTPITPINSPPTATTPANSPLPSGAAPTLSLPAVTALVTPIPSGTTPIDSLPAGTPTITVSAGTPPAMGSLLPADTTPIDDLPAGTAPITSIPSGTLSHVPFISPENVGCLRREAAILHQRNLLDNQRKALIDRAFADVDERILRRRAEFDQGLIHSDFNETNLLVSCGEISGVLDFGDMHRSLRVFDVAAAVLYLHLSDRLGQRLDDLCHHLLAGYRSVRAFTASPDALLTAMRARMACSLVYGLRTARINYRGGSVEYVLRTQSNGWETLERLSCRYPLQY